MKFTIFNDLWFFVFRYAIKELLNTEVDYVNDLAILIEVIKDIHFTVVLSFFEAWTWTFVPRRYCVTTVHRSWPFAWAFSTVWDLFKTMKSLETVRNVWRSWKVNGLKRSFCKLSTFRNVCKITFTFTLQKRKNNCS